MTDNVGLWSPKLWCDSSILYHLYRSYVYDVAPVTHVEEYLRRYVLQFVRMEYLKATRSGVYWIRPDDLDDLVQSVYLEAWSVLREKSYPTTTAGAFLGYLGSLLKSSWVGFFMPGKRPPIQTMMGCRRREPQMAECEPPAPYRPPSPADVEHSIFLREMPRLVEDRLVSRLRTTSPAEQNAARFIFRRLMQGKSAPHLLLAKAYGVATPEALVRRVCVLSRAILYEFREVLTRPALEETVVFEVS